MSKNNNTLLYKIEKNVPIPTRQGRRTGVFKQTLAQLKVGESTLAPADKKAGITGLSRTLGFKFVTRTIDEHTIRVWRVA